MDSASRSRRKLSGKAQHDAMRRQQQNQTFDNISSHPLCHSLVGRDFGEHQLLALVGKKVLRPRGGFQEEGEVHILNSALQRMGLF